MIKILSILSLIKFVFNKNLILFYLMKKNFIFLLFWKTSWFLIIYFLISFSLFRRRNFRSFLLLIRYWLKCYICRYLIHLHVSNTEETTSGDKIVLLLFLFFFLFSFWLNNKSYFNLFLDLQQNLYSGKGRKWKRKTLFFVWYIRSMGVCNLGIKSGVHQNVYIIHWMLKKKKKNKPWTLLLFLSITRSFQTICIWI